MNSLKVVFFCDWHDSNPYIDQLCQALDTEMVDVEVFGRSVFWLHRVVSSTQSVDVVHFQTLHRFFVSRNGVYYWIKFLLFVGQLFCLKLLGISTVLTIHEWEDKLSDGQLNISPWKANILISVFSAVITHCESTRKQVTESTYIGKHVFNRNIDRKFFTISHGNYIDVYDNSISSLESRKKLGVPLDTLNFLIFGGIHASKGVESAIETFIDLVSAVEANIHLMIAGKASLEMLTSLHSKSDDSPNISLFVETNNYIADEDIQLYMNACDVVILPYKIFTTSGVALLSMSFSKPCIAPNSGFFGETFRESGAFLYPSDEDRSLYNGMLQAINNRHLLESMGEHNFTNALSCSWIYVAEETRKVYEWSRAES